MATTPSDNLINKIGRVYIAQREFTDDNGKSVKYQKLVVEVAVKEEPYELEFKIDKKDAMIIGFADDLDNGL